MRIGHLPGIPAPYLQSEENISEEEDTLPSGIRMLGRAGKSVLYRAVHRYCAISKHQRDEKHCEQEIWISPPDLLGAPESSYPDCFYSGAGIPALRHREGL